MSRSKIATIRIQSPEYGTKRVETQGSESIADFLNKVQKEFNLGDIGWKVYRSREKKDWIRTSRAKTVDSYKIKHGDMLFLMLTDTNEAESPMDAAAPFVTVGEDEVDQILAKEDGKIYRNKNEQYCRHGPLGKCLHCSPLEPYDEQYLATCDPPIKYLSFHSYIRKLTGGVDKGKFATLENLSCRIKPGCKEHLPWPGGICTKCQPNAVTLNRQFISSKVYSSPEHQLFDFYQGYGLHHNPAPIDFRKHMRYRHVDNILFENPSLCDRFLNYWRSTGNQRLGMLYGRYEPHKDVPLGIKATVAAIYEPPQNNSKNKIELLPDPNEEAVNRVAEQLGIRPVGWIFTDLVAEDLKLGTVKNFRGNIDSHFLSAEECIMAADFQNKYTNPCKLSSDGHFGSKFVTVIVTGDSSNQIHFEGYQVTNQCMALVRDDCLIPTKDAPELGYIKESSNEQYVPDVFYKYTDEYGNEVTQLARPLPVEYLLVDITAAFPVEPKSTFTDYNGLKTFSIENRADIGEVQDFNNLISYMEQFPPEKFLEAVSDFHLLLFLDTNDMLPLKDKLQTLLEAVRFQDRRLALDFKKTENWATVEEMMAAHGPAPPPSRQTSYVGPGASPLPPIGASSSATAAASDRWTCAHCTFINQSTKTTCDMCSLPQH